MLKRGWFGGGLWKPKNVHSLEHLRYLYTVLSKNQVVQDSNRSLLVETLRSIAEILIWGDQNDSSVFDFFLEKNMLSFFLKIMKQRCGSYVCVQLLQTLNILFENIRNETSLYYLLSNNHVNSIIVHKFDFSDEEVMAYYISFLKTLSLKLNSHTISFFYNVHTNDFPLYTEAIKFFNHPESMVRIAVRTLTLNVYRVEDESMLRFIRDRTAAPYFSNLVWFIGNHILELDACVRNDIDHSSKTRLADLVAEHLDHLHYLNDILKLNITELNYVLADHLLNRLLVPLLVYSLNHHQNQDERPRVSRVVALFLLAQVFLIFSYSPLMQILAKILLHGDNSLFADNSPVVEGPIKLRPGFVAPEETLEKSLQSHSQSESNFGSQEFGSESSFGSRIEEGGSSSWRSTPAVPVSPTHPEGASSDGDSQKGNGAPRSHVPLSLSSGGISDLEATHVNITDEEKEKLLFSEISVCTPVNTAKEVSLSSKPFLQSILEALNCTENDYSALFSLCLLYALGHNTGVNRDLLASSLGTRDNGVPRVYYNSNLVELLLRIITQSANHSSKIRVVTLEMALNVLRHFIGLTEPPHAGAPRSAASSGGEQTGSCLRDQHLAALEGAKEEATLLLRNFYKGEEIFLDMFEDEWRELHRRPLNVEFLLQDASILLPPAGTPLTGIDFDKRLPCGEVERARRSMRVFFLIRELCLKIREESDPHLPLTNPAACVEVSDVLDLNNSDLIACVVITRDNQRTRRFLVIDVIQLILVEPDQRKMGWGVAKFVGFLQDLEVTGDKDDSRVLHITIHRPSASSLVYGRPATPLLAAKFIFDDHIRCMAAKQRLSKGRMKARQKKLHQIARLLELPNHLQPCPSPPAHALSTMRQEAQKRGGNRSGELRSRSAYHKSKFTASSRGPGVAFKKEGAPTHASEDPLPSPGGAEGGTDTTPPRRGSSRSGSRSSSRPRPRSEEIPLENLSSSLGGMSEVGGKKTEYSPDKEPVTSPEVPITSKSTNTQTINLVLNPVSVCSVPEQVPFHTASSQSTTSFDALPPFTLYIPTGTVIPVPISTGKETQAPNNPAVFAEASSSELSSGEPVVTISEAEEDSVEPHEETSFSSKPSCPKSSSFDVFENQGATKTAATTDGGSEAQPQDSDDSKAGIAASERVVNGNVCTPRRGSSATNSGESVDSDVIDVANMSASHSDTGYLNLGQFSPLKKVKPKGKVEII